MVFVFVLGVVLGILAAPLRRYGRASGKALAGGASVLLVLAVAGFVHTDAREGLATLEANRRQYLFVLACELPVLALALPVATQETLLARLGNPRCVHLVRGNGRRLARVFLALVTRAGKKQRSRQGSSREVIDKSLRHRHVLDRFGSTPRPVWPF